MGSSVDCSRQVEKAMFAGSVSRRDFIRMAAAGVGTAACPAIAAAAGGAGDSESAPRLSDHEALAYEKLEEKKVLCTLCPRKCSVADMERGYCGVRENQGGVYKTLVYARACSAHIDPIEKKPLFHFLPGTTAFSIATAGCNVECKFCQNWQISQFRPEQVESVYLPPEKVAALARHYGCSSIAYTYSEPVIFYEYMLDCAREGNGRDVHSVMISNGYIMREPMVELCKHLSAVKVDLKAFTEEFYKKYVSGRLKPVLETLELLVALGMYTEIVMLLLPGLNDSTGEIRQMCKWVRSSLGPDVPVHFSRFHPNYKMKNLSATPVSTLERARHVAVDEGIHYAYIGNVPGHEYESTFCHGCGKKLIVRYAYKIIENHVSDGKCEFCGVDIPGVWKS